MKYKKINKLNKICFFAESLFVDFNASKNGISVKDINGKWKFFHIDYIYMEEAQVKRYIKKECAEPDLQTNLSSYKFI